MSIMVYIHQPFLALPLVWYSVSAAPQAAVHCQQPPRRGLHARATRAQSGLHKALTTTRQAGRQAGRHAAPAASVSQHNNDPWVQSRACYMPQPDARRHQHAQAGKQAGRHGLPVQQLHHTTPRPSAHQQVPSMRLGPSCGSTVAPTRCCP